MGTETPTGGTNATPNVPPRQMTDTGNADLLVARYGATLRFCADMGRWLAWTGSRWELRADDADAYQAATETIDTIVPGDSERLAKHKFRSYAAPKITAMVNLARRHPDMRIEADQLDADPYALNTPGGVVDLRTGAITPCDPNLLHTKQTGRGVATNRAGTTIDFDPYMPMWNKFLETTFGGDDDLIDYMQELAGLSAIGEIIDHILPFFDGSGGNGKSQYIETQLAVLHSYATPCPAEFLLAKGTQHPTEIARLRGIRFAPSSEINEGSTFDEAKVKLLTGGDTLTGRFMRQDFFDFTPTHTLFLIGNHRPSVPSGGDSFWRRLRVTPFKHKVPDAEKIDGLAGKMFAAEGPAILAWIVKGAIRVSARGLRSAPQTVLDATGEYAEQENPIKRFIEECCTVDDDAEAKPAVLHGAYIGWAKRNHEKTPNAVHFGRAMAAAGHPSSKTANTGSTRIYKGLRVKTECLPEWSSDRLANTASWN